MAQGVSPTTGDGDALTNFGTACAETRIGQEPQFLSALLSESELTSYDVRALFMQNLRVVVKWRASRQASAMSAQIINHPNVMGTWHTVPTIAMVRLRTMEMWET